jgi:large subunit ribosomal protein L21
MLNYIIVEIKGKQYKVTPKQKIKVDYVGDLKKLETDKVLVKSEGDKLTLGAPYLKDKVVFDVLEEVKAPKIRVAKFHAKANTRKVRGFTKKLSLIQLAA